MRRYFHFILTGLAATALFLACDESTSPREPSRPAVPRPSFTLASNFTSTPVARGNAGAFHIQSKAAGFDVQIKAKDNTDIAVANVVVAAGGHSGWHSHPGPVLVVVKTGVLTAYRADDPKCSPAVHAAGTVFIERGGHPMIVRNEGSTEATVTAIYFAPQGAALRIDQPASRYCAF